jgi:hypothetical protein
MVMNCPKLSPSEVGIGRLYVSMEIAGNLLTLGQNMQDAFLGPSDLWTLFIVTSTYRNM